MPVKIISILLLSFLLVVPLGFLIREDNLHFDLPTAEELLDLSYMKQLDKKLSDEIIKFPTIGWVGTEFLRLSGKTLQNGLFVTENALYKEVVEQEPKITMLNTKGIVDFVQKYYIPTYCILIPTACAIKQYEIPEYVTLFNQKGYIESVYNQMAGVVTAVDVYPVLFGAMGQYIYYRTQDELTGLGGHYVYMTLADKMRIGPRPLSRFQIQHLEYNYYGSLYNPYKYPNIKPDTISVYALDKFYREYSVIKYNGIYSKMYSSLYDESVISKLPMTDKTDVVFGGSAPWIDIHVQRANYSDKILIIGGKSMKAFVPFLAGHFSKLTLIDLSRCTEKELESIQIEGYDQIIFAFSVDEYMKPLYDKIYTIMRK